MDEITVFQLKECLQEKSRVLLDVRTVEEYLVSHLPCVHIPLHELQDRLKELDPNQPLAIICRSGGRSGQATHFLEAQGFEDVVNVRGGMKAWRDEIDPRVEVA